MIEVTRVVEATPDEVMAVVADGWTYASWVVGASAIRAVEAGFPAVGTRLYHAFGCWPVLIDDSTSVLAYRPGRAITLEARGWPLGQARIEIDVEPVGAGSRVSIREDASKGPGRLIPEPVRQLAIAPRNAETLRRLAYLAEARSEPD